MQANKEILKSQKLGEKINYEKLKKTNEKQSIFSTLSRHSNILKTIINGK